MAMDYLARSPAAGIDVTSGDFAGGVFECLAELCIVSAAWIAARARVGDDIAIHGHRSGRGVLDDLGSWRCTPTAIGRMVHPDNTPAAVPWHRQPPPPPR